MIPDNNAEKHSALRFTPNDHQGFSLIEIVFTLLILVVAIVPMLNAYSPAIFATAYEEEKSVFTNQARGTLSRVAALDFRILNELVQTGQTNPVNLSSLFGTEESFSFRGSDYAPTVLITDQGGSYGGLLEITVIVSYVSLKAFRADY